MREAIPEDLGEPQEEKVPRDQQGRKFKKGKPQKRKSSKKSKAQTQYEKQEKFWNRRAEQLEQELEVQKQKEHEVQQQKDVFQKIRGGGEANIQGLSKEEMETVLEAAGEDMPEIRIMLGLPGTPPEAHSWP